MKTTAFILTLFTVLTSFAADLSVDATLDFRSTYGGFNAGLYQVTSEFVANKASAEGHFVQRQYRDDNDLRCVTEVSFEVGTLKTTIKSIDTGASFSRTQALVAKNSIQDESATCTTNMDSFVGTNSLYIATTGTPYTLSIAAPADYKEVQLWLSPLQTVQVKAVLTKSKNTLQLQPQGLFAADSLFADKNYNQLALNYYLTAVQGPSTLSLAVGTVPMSIVK